MFVYNFNIKGEKVKAKKSSLKTMKSGLEMITFYDMLHKVKTISKNSPYWKNTEPGTVIEFKNQDDAQKAIDEGYARDLQD